MYSFSYIFLVFVIISNFLIASPLVCQKNKSNNWKLSKKSEDIVVFILDHKESGLKEVLGIMKVKSSLGAIVKVIQDYENHKNWMYSVKSVKLLESKKNTDWLIHSTTESHWPVKSRELIVRSKLYQNKDNCSIIIKAKAEPNHLPLNPNKVRINEMNSSWSLKPVDNDEIEVKLQLRVNLGGSIPLWLMNMVVDKGPFSTLKNLRKEVYKKSPQTKLSFIKNKCD